MTYIAMNRFQVAAGKGAEFEALWRERESFLAGVEGFVEFRLLRGEGGVYVSHALWESEATFRAWTESEAFRKAHAGGGARDIVEGPPQFSGYTVVLGPEADR